MSWAERVVMQRAALRAPQRERAPRSPFQTRRPAVRVGVRMVQAQQAEVKAVTRVRLLRDQPRAARRLLRTYTLPLPGAPEVRPTGRETLPGTGDLRPQPWMEPQLPAARFTVKVMLPEA